MIGRAIIRDLYDRDRAAAMIGLVTTVMVLAPMMAPLIGGLLDTLFGWESIFIFVALFAARCFSGRLSRCRRRGSFPPPPAATASCCPT